MESDVIRKQLHLYLDKADEKFLKIVYALMKIEEEEDKELSDDQKNILEERLEKYMSNPKDVSSIEDALARIEKKL